MVLDAFGPLCSGARPKREWPPSAAPTADRPAHGGSERAANWPTPALRPLRSGGSAFNWLSGDGGGSRASARLNSKRDFSERAAGMGQAPTVPQLASPNKPTRTSARPGRWSGSLQVIAANGINDSRQVESDLATTCSVRPSEKTSALKPQ